MSWTALYAVAVTVVLIVVTAWALLLIIRERRHNRSRRAQRLYERDRRIVELEHELFGWHADRAPEPERDREPGQEMRAFAVAWSPEKDRQQAERISERARHLDETLPDPSRDIRQLADEVRDLATSWKQPRRTANLVEDARGIRDLVYRMSHSTTRLQRCAQQLITHAEHGASALTNEEVTHLRREMQALETMVRNTDHALFVLSVFLQDHPDGE